MMTIVPVQWRDYKNKKDVEADFNADKDFRVCGLFGDGLACNKTDLINEGIKTVKVRYNNLQNVIVINLKGETK
tara:strand:- start:14062 stop:14283 length:222 start_codon:yes stop_codon:yes gene_type:complete